MKIIDGEKLAEKILLKVKKNLPSQKLSLGAVQIGENPVSDVFINKKRKLCEKTGIGFYFLKFSSKISKDKLKKEIEKIGKRKDISGLIIQLPLPKKFSVQEILNTIPPEKDIEFLSEISAGKFYTGSFQILPPTAGAVSEIFREYNIKIKGKNIVVFGSGILVGRPVSFWLIKQGATVSVLNEFTKNISDFTRKADIIISGVGKPNLVKGDMIKKGAIVIDAGSSFKNNRIVGDVDFKSVSKKTSYVTPVPGGIGPITVACLLENLVKIK